MQVTLVDLTDIINCICRTTELNMAFDGFHLQHYLVSAWFSWAQCERKYSLPRLASRL